MKIGKVQKTLFGKPLNRTEYEFYRIHQANKGNIKKRFQLYKRIRTGHIIRRDLEEKKMFAETRRVVNKEQFYKEQRDLLWKNSKFHDVYIFKVKKNHLPFCLRCFQFGVTYINAHTKNKDCRPKYKTFIKDLSLREKIIKVFKWYFTEFTISNPKCANPKCREPIHIEYIFRAISKLSNINRFYHLLENNITPTFLCCFCFDLQEFEELKVIA